MAVVSPVTAVRVPSSVAPAGKAHGAENGEDKEEENGVHYVR